MPKSQFQTAETAGIAQTKVFLSYSRQNSAFAERLRNDLIGSGFDAYLDKHDILPGEDWRLRLGALIAGADTVVFCMSPASISSEMCDWEVNEAERLEKRILPVIAVDVDDSKVPQRLKRLNYLFLRNDTERAGEYAKLIDALERDIAWVREHTLLGEKAGDWEEAGQPVNRLLRGDDILEAEKWLARRPSHDQSPTDLHVVFIEASRARATLEAKRAKWRSRIITGASLTAAAIFAWLGWLMYGQWQEGLKRESLTLADAAQQAIRDGDPVTGMLLALEALPDEKSLALTQRLRPYQAPAEFALNEANQPGLWTDRVMTSFLRGAQATAAALSPDGKSVLTVADDKTARLWSAETGRLRATLPHGGRWPLYAVAFSPDGKTTATGGDGSAKLWDAETGALLATLPQAGGVELLAFSPDGKTLFTGQNASRPGYLWDVATGAQRAKLEHAGGITAVAYSPDSRAFLMGSANNFATIWDVATGTLCATLNHEGPVAAPMVAVAFSPDGKRIVTGSINSTLVWDATTHERLNALPYLVHENTIAFSPDGKTLFIGSSELGLLLDAVTGQSRAILKHDKAVVAVAFSADSQTLLTGSEDDKARLWNATTGVVLSTLRHEGSVVTVALSPDRKTILTRARDNTVRLWTVGQGAQRTTLRPGGKAVYATAFSPDGKSVLIGSHDKVARLCDAETGAERLTFRHDGVVAAVAFSPDSKKVLTGSYDKTARLWDATTGALRATLRNTSVVTTVAFSPDGNTLLTGSLDINARDKIVRLWDATTGSLRFSLIHDAVVAAAAFSPNSKMLLTGSQDGKARLWNTDTGALHATLMHRAPVNAVAFSPDGRTLLTGSGDRTAQIWDAATGEPRATLSDGVQSLVTTVAFSPDGKTALTGDLLQNLRLWKADTGELLFARRYAESSGMAAFRDPDGGTVGSEIKRAIRPDLEAVAFSPDGKIVLTGFVNSTLVWDTNTGDMRAILRRNGWVNGVAFSPDGRMILVRPHPFMDGTVTLWNTPPPIQRQVEREQQRLTRCLAPYQRAFYHLSPTPPRWCHERHLWPFHDVAKTTAPPFTAGERFLKAFDAFGGPRLIHALATTRNWVAVQAQKFRPN